MDRQAEQRKNDEDAERHYSGSKEHCATQEIRDCRQRQAHEEVFRSHQVLLEWNHLFEVKDGTSENSLRIIKPFLRTSCGLDIIQR